MKASGLLNWPERRVKISGVKMVRVGEMEQM
jgi:hypothetical protein